MCIRDRKYTVFKNKNKKKIIGKITFMSCFLPEKNFKIIENPYMAIIIEYIFYLIGMIKNINTVSYTHLHGYR